MNFNRMTIREGKVFKMHRQQIGGYCTDMAAKNFEWVIHAHAAPRFTGSQEECLAYIASQGAEYQA